MFSASLYILACSARNRLRVRVRRLKEPRYLVGAIVGAAYVYFSFFARMRVGARPRRGRGTARTAIPAALTAAGPAMMGLLLLAVSAVGWFLPFESGLLEFTEAEIALLFPAPVSRHQLLIHRMVRSQLGLLFGAVVIGIARPAASGVSRLQTSLGVWLLLFTLRVGFTGITLARSRWQSPDPAQRRIGRLPAVATFAAVVLVGITLYRDVVGGPEMAPTAFIEHVGARLTHGAAGTVLWPFIALTRPLFAPSLSSFARAMVSAVAVLVAAIVWVVWSDSTFHDLAAEASDRRRASAAKTKSGFKVRGPGPTLALSGRPELAFAWKGAVQTLRIVDRRSWLRLLIIVTSTTIPAIAMGLRHGFSTVLGIFACVGAGFAILLAPQALRTDLRQDLLHLEQIKTWPVSPAAVVRGEMMWPAALLTALAWVLLGFALLFSGAVFDHVSLVARAAIAAAVAIAAPALILAQYTIHNGVALMLPAWVPLGSARPRGFDAMGQRLILLAGTWLLLAALALPGAIAGGIVWFAFGYWIGMVALIPGAAVATAIIAIEVLIASEALGPAFERVDVGEVERGE
jgi:hypothetical protein